MTISVGTIFVAKWGYEQTNVDFYQVVKVTEKTVVIQEIDQQRNEGDMRGTCTPVPFNYVGEPIRRKVCRAVPGNPFVRIDDHTFAYVWDGQPQEFTSYA